jgi:Fur family peroxide stress response transcriptional regulator
MNDIEGLGFTKQRQVVLQVIRESNEHPTANEVFEDARRLLPSISFATVYNSLRYLRDAGHIAEICFGNGASRFDALTSRHDHAICTKCGKMVDMEIELPPEVIKFATEFSKFKLESIELTLRGICLQCSNK